MNPGLCASRGVGGRCLGLNSFSISLDAAGVPGNETFTPLCSQKPNMLPFSGVEALFKSCFLILSC